MLNVYRKKVDHVFIKVMEKLDHVYKNVRSEERRVGKECRL